MIGSVTTVVEGLEEFGGVGRDCLVLTVPDAGAQKLGEKLWRGVPRRALHGAVEPANRSAS